MKVKQSYKLPIVISVALHVAIFACLFLHFPHTMKQESNNTKIVQAVAINASQLADLQKPSVPNPAPSLVKPVPQTEIRKIEQVALKESDPVKPKPIPKVEPKPEPTPTVAKPVEEEVLTLQEPTIEDKLAKQQLAQKKKEEQKKQEIKKKLQLAQQRKAEEAKRLEEELAQETKQVEEVKTSQVPEDHIPSVDEQAEASSEDNKVSSEEANNKGEAAAKTSSADKGELDKYKQLIVQAIGKKWVMPETDNKELTCKLLVNVGPGGVVLNVAIIKESGDANLDRSARNAIIKASPLPVPDDTELFDNFRALRLTFRPQGIISG